MSQTKMVGIHFEPEKASFYCEHWKMFPRDCEVFTLKTFKSHLEIVLGNLLYVTLIQQGELTR